MIEADDIYWNIFVCLVSSSQLATVSSRQRLLVDQRAFDRSLPPSRVTVTGSNAVCYACCVVASRWVRLFTRPTLMCHRLSEI